MAKETEVSREAAAAFGRMGGQARGRKLSEEARRTAAQHAARARWKDHIKQAKRKRPKPDAS